MQIHWKSKKRKKVIRHITNNLDNSSDFDQSDEE